MTFRKSGILSLVAGLAVFGVACEQADVIIPPAPPPALQISISPTAPIALVVGQSAQVTASVTGGDASTNRAIAYSISPANGVVTVNASTGAITAATPGTTTVVATAAADPTLRASVQVNVTAAPTPPPPPPPPPPPAPTTLSIARITAGGTNTPVNISNVAGQIDVVLTLDAPANSGVARVEVLIDGVVACSQAFTAGSASAGDGVQAPIDIVCSINTARVGANGIADFMNGSRLISARAVSATGATLASATPRSVEFMNVNVLNATVETQATPGAPGTAASPAGLLWREGNVIVTVRPAIFTPGALSVITICVTPVDGPGAGTASCRTANSLTANAFVATFPKGTTLGAGAGGSTGGVAGVSTTDLRVTANTIVGGEQGPGLVAPLGAPAGAAIGPTIRLDNAAPSTPPTTALNVIDPANPFVGLGFGFTAGNVITAPAADLAPGVGGVTNTFHVVQFTAANNAVTSQAGLAGLVAGGTQVTSGADLAGMANNNTTSAFILIVRTRDALFNEVFTRVPGAFGFDSNTPVFTIVSGPANMSINSATAFTFNPVTTLAGFGPNPFQVRIVRYTAAATRACVDVNTGAATAVPGAGCGFVNLTLGGNTFTVPAVDGYYEITVRVQSRAGTLSAEQTRTVLRDITNPGVTVNSHTIAGNEIQINATITDNVDIRGFDRRIQFAGAAAPTGANDANLPIEMLNVVGSFGHENRIASQAVSQSITIWRSLGETDGAGAPTARTNATGVGIGVFDIARNFGATFITVGGQAGGASPALLTNFTLSLSGGTACNGITPIPAGDTGVSCAAGVPSSRTVTATASGPTSVFVEPFTMVHFYAVDPSGNVWYLGQTSGGTPTEQAAPSPTRTWTYTFSFNATGLRAGGYQIFAVGGNAARDGLRSPTAAITVQGAANQP